MQSLTDTTMASSEYQKIALITGKSIMVMTAPDNCESHTKALPLTRL